VLLSAEIRLFWFGAKPQALEDWFFSPEIHERRAEGPEERTDVYLCDAGQIELGIKTRGKNPGVEVKGLIATLPDPIEFASYQVPIELWSKWPSRSLARLRRQVRRRAEKETLAAQVRNRNRPTLHG
jgi:hypothetical protein